MAMIKSLCLTLVICIVGSNGRKIQELDKRLRILEQKFGFQVYENTLLKAEIDSLKNTMEDMAENISSIVRDSEDYLRNKVSKPGEYGEEFKKMAELKQNLDKIVQTTVPLLNAFKEEKEERMKQKEEIETLKQYENVHKIHFDMLNKSLKETKIDLEIQKDAYKDDKEGMVMEIKDLKSFRKAMEESPIKLKVDRNENEIAKVSTRCDRINNTMETRYGLVLTSMAELSEKVDSRQVSFSARLSKSVEDLAPWTTLIFQDIIINKGNAYSSQTGIFTAPLSGVYVFYTHILAANRSIEMCLQHNGRTKLWLYVNGPGHGGDSNLIVLQLTKGDEIKVVKHGPYGAKPFYVHPVWSTFSGYMIYQT